MNNFVFLDDEEEKELEKKYNKKNKNNKEGKGTQDYNDMVKEQEEYWNNYETFKKILLGLFEYKLYNISDSQNNILKELISILENNIYNFNIDELENQFKEQHFYMGKSKFSDNIRKEYMNKIFFYYQLKAILDYIRI